ncbi:NmrA family NAD(P)-binding protein [Dactylosporangium matsuzakiense]|uniref:NAD(P)-dependent oxidoreductase n=1 Tax=Dactylosporangium matsuzakiense TaxID=53360 RepID=A0A9W6KGL3_9ACTN|nr:NmrA family NAD(P)-binding protein [Dactylosporangium matsuzakiense]UWZ42069.1 NmrA family NAD(P)-binding protein [Dactylosporangium matsuzakiense]GLK99689.1 NAD(P)-dependent oxidoreductase [Dactylosporangium matsuzakiense]
MSIVVTAASGQLGRLTVEALLARGVPASDIVATSRDVTRIKDFADRGVVVRRADFAEPDSLPAAFAGADRLLLISTTTPSERVANHRRAIDAAVAAGASLVAYTSMLRADTSTTSLAPTHSATEEYLRERLPSVMLRNGWYLENYTSQLPQVRQGGVVVGAAGHGRISAATRSDYAGAAASVLTTDGHAGNVYELGGDEAFTLAELAAAIAAATGERIEYAHLTADAFTQVLTDAGLPAELAHVLADADLAMSRDEMFTDSGDLRRLIGRPTTTLAEAITAALR